MDKRNQKVVDAIEASAVPDQLQYFAESARKATGSKRLLIIASADHYGGESDIMAHATNDELARLDDDGLMDAALVLIRVAANALQQADIQLQMILPDGTVVGTPKSDIAKML